MKNNWRVIGIHIIHSAPAAGLGLGVRMSDFDYCFCGGGLLSVRT